MTQFTCRMRHGGWGIMVACTVFLASCQKQEAEAGRPETTVRIVEAQLSDYQQTVTLTGEVVAHVQANLAFRVSGQVTQWFADIGAHVDEGELLAKIDPREQEADVQASEAAVKAAEAQLRQASATLTRQNTLMTQGFTTRRDLDQAETAARTAASALDAASAELEAARTALSYTELRSSAAGIVTVRHAEAGQVVQAAQTMFSVAKDGPRDAIFNVHEGLLFMKPASEDVTLALVSDPSVTAIARVSEISPTIDDKAGTVRVKLAMRETPDRMTLGSSVTGVARFEPAKVIALPWTALTAADGKPAVWIVDPKDSTVSLKPIEVKTYESGRVLVASGLSVGDKVVAEGAKFLRPGLAVHAVAEEQAK
ncbi:efflux RND transporter periplasmic adaptor subunit [Ensifer sp. 4252]|uniref:efflux RND transporter periplasmic adaptor subunit n=1 Tax=Ensifer sp. 4252 TaxID=3373915 RepID=UPI003D258AE4